MDEIDEEKLLQIINHYGLKAQLKYIHTEYFELDEAVLSGDVDHIAEELADVYIMLNQIQLYFDIKDEKITKTAFFKVERQLERIEKEKDNE